MAVFTKRFRTWDVDNMLLHQASGHEPQATYCNPKVSDDVTLRPGEDDTARPASIEAA